MAEEKKTDPEAAIARPDDEGILRLVYFTKRRPDIPVLLGSWNPENDTAADKGMAELARIAGPEVDRIELVKVVKSVSIPKTRTRQRAGEIKVDVVNGEAKAK